MRFFHGWTGDVYISDRPISLKLLWATNPIAACSDACSVSECKFQLGSSIVHGVILSEIFPGIDSEILIWSGFLSQNRRKWRTTGSYKWEHCWVWNLFLLQVNVTRYFCLLVSNGNLTLAFRSDKYYWWLLYTQTVRISKLEANLAAHPETLTW